MRPLARACSLEPLDSRLHRRRVDVGSLDDDARRKGGARERLLHAVVGLDRRQRLRERVHARLHHAELDRRQREDDQEPAGQDGRQKRPAEDAVDDRAPDPAFAVVAAQAADQRNPKPVDPVAEPREQRRKHRQRAEHRRSRPRGSSRSPNEAKILSPVRNMPAIAVMTVSPEIEHCAPGSRGGDLERVSFAAARRPLLTLALQVEERVVDTDREPDQEHDRGPLRRDRDGLARTTPTMPKVAITAVRASSSGMPAATSAPKRDHEDDERDRKRQHPGLGQIVRGGGRRPPWPHSHIRTRR